MNQPCAGGYIWWLVDGAGESRRGKVRREEALFTMLSKRTSGLKKLRKAYNSGQHQGPKANITNRIDVVKP